MREPVFIRKNSHRWKSFEELLQRKQKVSADTLASLFVQVLDDLAYAKTYYAGSSTATYLNKIAAQVHQAIYRNKKERSDRLITFWTKEIPLTSWQTRFQLLYATLFFVGALLVGAVSAHYDDTFVRLILGDAYVNMTLENIANNDPMGVYRTMHEMDMFVMIAFNNIRVSFMVFVAGLIASAGTVMMLAYNGIMLGSFQYFFYKHDLLLSSFLTIWIHGTLEISAIVIAGGAGLTMGNSLLFPGTYARLVSFRRGAKQGLKLIIGLLPVFLLAAFLEGFVTRHTEWHWAIKSLIIGLSAYFVLWYFVIYPRQLFRKTL